MPFLDVIATGRIDHGGTADVTSLTITSTVDAPAGSTLVMVILTAPQNVFGGLDASPASPSLITDDGPGGSATWIACPINSDPGKAYDFGSPADNKNEFDFGLFGSAFNNGAIVQAVIAIPNIDKPSGTNFTIETAGIGINGGDAQYVHACILAFDSNILDDPLVLLSGRTIDPTEDHTGAGTGTALGDWLFSDFDLTQTFIAICGAANSPTSGTENMIDTLGNWTSEDQDGSDDCMGDASGVVLGVFVVEGPDVTPSQSAVGGFQESVHGVTPTGQSAIMLVGVAAAPPPPPTNAPVFNHRFRAND